MTTQPQPDVSALTPVAEEARRGAEGNQRLTAWVGAALLVGFSAQVVTLFNVHWWLTAHVLIGLALLPPTALKIVSTGYRFARYYTHTPSYRQLGPPRPLLRIIAPLLLLNTVFILLTGVAIMIGGPYRWQIERLHDLSSWTWLALVGIHVLAYLWRLPRLMLADIRTRDALRGPATQRILLASGSVALGIALALILMPWVRAWIAR